MNKILPLDILAIMCICFCAFSAYHAPQPVYPSIAADFGLPHATVGLISTFVILPMGLAPVFYGLLLGKFPVVPAFRCAAIIYALGLLPVPLGGGWHALLAGRLVQGLTIPALMVCALTYIASRYSGLAMQKYMGFYAFSLIAGGFIGRLISGAIDTLTGSWRLAFLSSFILMAAALPLFLFLKPVANRVAKVDISAIGRLVHQKNMLKLLVMPACMVMASTSVLNTLAFRLREIDPGITPFSISLVYLGVALCATTGLFSAKILGRLKWQMYGMVGGVAVFLLFFPLLLSKNVGILAFGLVALNFGYSFVYVSLPGIVNRYSQCEKSVTNGVYLTIYYLSGAFGSYFPGLLHEGLGFVSYIWILFFAASISLALAFNMRHLKIDK